MLVDEYGTKNSFASPVFNPMMIVALAREGVGGVVDLGLKVCQSLPR
jgi:hypothetical protein